ncbi:DUF6624 domain-containing protein [Aquimarina litoralis]|uniref:DUF6624 domain-containing protein n=1 Tax=Aquimarina litoralis TaxID=584605 RepID=UPI001C586647|nr:DUF6624 domain-containing protein [Aquimarina litoralis]MBW1296762.1 hypothetical protein [Aquimarina litoralis]
MILNRWVTRLIILFILCVTNASCQTKWQGKRITLPKISKEIISLRKNDQKYRNKYIELHRKGKKGTKKYNEVVEKLIAIDESNTARMEAIVDQYGWPTFDKVGEEASNIAWLLVQHADRNPFFQEKCLKLIKEALDKKLINPSNYAYLYDRVQLARGEKQLYATQSSTNHNMNEEKTYFQPIADESKVQERREQMNIEQHIAHYALSLNFEYTVPSEKEAVERAKEFENSYNLHIKKARQAMLDKQYLEAADFFIIALKSDGYTKAEDYVEAARAISLSKHKDMGAVSYYYLLKAVFKGYKNVDEFTTNPDFENLKQANLEFWDNVLMKNIARSKAVR